MVTFPPPEYTMSTPQEEQNQRMFPSASSSNQISTIYNPGQNRPTNVSIAPSASFCPVESTRSFSDHFRTNGYSGSRSLWTKYCLLCITCGSAATILAGIFLVVAALFRYYTTSTNYFETVPTYIPAILLSMCGISTIAFSCKRNRNIILLRITACWSLCSAALSSVITITTSVIHMNRLQTLKECVYHKNPSGCSCYSHVFDIGGVGGPTDGTTYVFENTPDCEVIHGTLYSCLRAVFAISIVAVLLSIFLCMLLHQLILHERKKAYWSRIRRVNSDWSADFVAFLGRPLPRESSNLVPLLISRSSTMSAVVNSSSIISPAGWGPPPPYQEIPDDNPPPSLQAQPAGQFPTSRSWLTQPPPQNQNMSMSHPIHGLGLGRNTSNSTTHHHELLNPHPFSPTITSIDPAQVFHNMQLQRDFSRNPSSSYTQQYWKACSESTCSDSSLDLSTAFENDIENFAHRECNLRFGLRSAKNTRTMEPEPERMQGCEDSLFMLNEDATQKEDFNFSNLKPPKIRQSVGSGYCLNKLEAKDHRQDNRFSSM